jgi:HAE1 family hydrophobic/amphiphilic exporter-1
VIADTVAAPIEQQVNGVDRMLYMESTSASDGSYTLNVTFEVGTDIDIASVLGAEPRWRSRSRSCRGRAPPGGDHQQGLDQRGVGAGAHAEGRGRARQLLGHYLANYLLINVNDRIKRIPGVGDTLIRPSKDYGMRIWLDPDRLKARGLTASTSCARCRSRTCRWRRA